jgi:hypothetical protein
MSLRSEMLARRRQQLIAQSIALRSDVALQGQSLGHSLGTAQIGLRVLDRVRKHPEWIAGAALGLALIKPRRLSALLQMGIVGLRTWRQVTPLLQHVIGRRG